MLPTGETMRAIIWEDVGRVSLQRRPVPRPGPGQALVEIITNGMCSSDNPIVEGLVDGVPLLQRRPPRALHGLH